MHPGNLPGYPAICSQTTTLAGSARVWPATSIWRDQNVTGSEYHPGGYQVARAEAVNGIVTGPCYPKANNPLPLQSVAHLPCLQSLLPTGISDNLVLTGGTDDGGNNKLDPMSVRARQFTLGANRHDPDMNTSLTADIPCQSHLEFHLHRLSPEGKLRCRTRADSPLELGANLTDRVSQTDLTIYLLISRRLRHGCHPPQTTITFRAPFLYSSREIYITSEMSGLGLRPYEPALTGRSDSSSDGPPWRRPMGCQTMAWSHPHVPGPGRPAVLSLGRCAGRSVAAEALATGSDITHSATTASTDSDTECRDKANLQDATRLPRKSHMRSNISKSP
jgi:hypothetical protein